MQIPLHYRELCIHFNKVSYVSEFIGTGREQHCIGQRGS